MTIYSPNISRLVGVDSQQYKHSYRSLSQYLTTKNRGIYITSLQSFVLVDKKNPLSWNKSYSLDTGRLNNLKKKMKFHQMFAFWVKSFCKTFISKTNDECKISFYNTDILHCPCCSSFFELNDKPSGLFLVLNIEEVLVSVKTPVIGK